MDDVLYTGSRGEERDSTLRPCSPTSCLGMFCPEPDDQINPYISPLVVMLAKGEKLALIPIFLGSLFFRLDECAQNLVKSMGPYTFISYANTSFLQLFLWERFKTTSAQS